MNGEHNEVSKGSLRITLLPKIIPSIIHYLSANNVAPTCMGIVYTVQFFTRNFSWKKIFLLLFLSARDKPVFC